VKPVLLPDNVRPQKYDLHFNLNFEKDLFTVDEKIHVKVAAATKELQFHALELEVENVSLRLADGKEVQPSSQAIDNEVLTLTFAEELPAGELDVSLKASAPFNKNMTGLYSYQGVDGDTPRTFACTQFEATDARRAFVCIDEPTAKATFNVVMTLPKDMVGLSNMPITNEESGDSTKTLHFGETPVMSTYLLALVAGVFESVEAVTKTGTVVRVWTPLGRKGEGEFAADIGARVLDFFAEYFDIPFPLPKQDMVTIAEFAAGAMENWGLVTYRETALLFDPAKSTTAAKKRVAEVVAHELAHQWFGNLVTMQWWTDLWLNEGFATWVGTLAVDYLLPTWNVWTNFLSMYTSRAFDSDGLPSTHPVEVPIAEAREVNDVFDNISYCKGASTIRMVHSFLGEEAFRNGLRIYLKRHKYGNAGTMDLWKAWEEASGKAVSSLMHDWTKTEGHPLVTASAKEEGDVIRVHVSQERYCTSGVTEDMKKQKWFIPINVVSSNGDKMVFELHDKEGEFTVKKANWVKINAGQGGFYRVKYDDYLMKGLNEALSKGELDGTDRLGMVMDISALPTTGDIPTDQALRMIMACSNETDYSIWSIILGFVGSVENVFDDDELEEKNNAFRLQLAAKAAERIGFDAKEGENEVDGLLRGLLVGFLVIPGSPFYQKYEKVYQQMYALFKAGDTKGAIDACPANLRASVYKFAVKYMGEEGFNMVYDIAMNAPMQDEKNRGVMNLGCSTDVETLKKVAELTLDGVKVKHQDAFYVLFGIARTPKGERVALDYLIQKWAEIRKTFGEGQFLLSRMVEVVAGNVSREDRANELRSFLDSAEGLKDIRRSIGEILAGVDTRVAWQKRDQAAVKAFFLSL